MQDGNNDEPGWVFKPGDTPGQAPVTPTPSVAPQPTVSAAAPSQPLPPPIAPVQPSPSPESTPQVQPAVPLLSQIPQGATAQTEQLQDYSQDEDYPHIEWTASEYVAHQKSAGWYGLLAIASIGIAAITYFVTRGDLVSTGVVLVLGVMLGIFAARQPHEITYAVNNIGVVVGQKFYPYESFKTFSVVHGQGLGYISLEPLKRFMPPLTIHYDPNDEDRIANTLSEYLPREEHKPDIVDGLTRRFRF